MKLSWTRRMIASAALAVGLLGTGASVASAQATSPGRYGEERTGTAQRTETEYGRRFDWGWLGLLGLLGLFGARKAGMHDTRGGMYERRETYEPRPTR